MDQQKTIGKYQILERIAAGSQGSVDRAFDPEEGRLAAIKLLHPSLLSDQVIINRFRREARLATSVNHPNVVRIFDVGEHEGQLFIAMEFLPITLRRLIDNGRFSETRAADLATQIADGLGAIHKLDIVHRDMKPHNVLLTQDGVAKITDFGIARGEEWATITDTGGTMGTPHYMAPEQANGERADARSDVYALGCLMYQMLTGEVPFLADTALAVLKKQVEQRHRPLSEVVSGIRPALIAVVDRALQKDPNNRFANGGEMARALRAAMVEPAKIDNVDSPDKPVRGGAKPKPTTGVEPSPKPGARPPRVPVKNNTRKFKVPVGAHPGDGAAGTNMKRWIRAISAIVVISLFGLIAWALSGPTGCSFCPQGDVVEIVHWSTGHLTRDGLLPEMAEQFNKENHKTPDGDRIRVKVFDAPSELQAAYLVPRVKFGTRLDLNEITNGYVDENILDPTILTPSSAHWLVSANYDLGRDVVDIEASQSIVQPVIGIVTYEDMARCLGWPDKALGFADIIALREDPEGWASYPCSKASWGQRPLLAFTDPTTSSTGRSLHLGLYSIGAAKAPEDLTVSDVNDPFVVDYVKNFQSLIDHYLIGTTVLNTKIYQGKRFGHFFVMPEDNLIHLYEGTEQAYINGEKVTAPPISESMVMIYPKEGAMPRNNCACIVDADWVSPEQVAASAVWIDYIRNDSNQRAFMSAGFRPGTDISLSDPASKITAEFGLNPAPPAVVLNPSLTKPEVAKAIDENWIHVKRPGIVNFVVDISGSMDGVKLNQAKAGLTMAIDSMATNNQVGFLSFSDTVQDGSPIFPLSENRFDIVAAVDSLRANGQTALYDAIKKGIEGVDSAIGDPNAIRAIVVLTDGHANTGETRLDDLIDMSSTAEVHVANFAGFAADIQGRDDEGRLVAKNDIIGSALAIDTEHDIQIFFIGIGDDADIQVGRMLAGATSAEFQGVAEDDLANLLEEFSKYF